MPEQRTLDFSRPPLARSAAVEAEEQNRRDYEDLDLCRYLARRTDPASSHEAARREVGSGRAATDVARVLAAVYEAPGLTSRQYAEGFGLDRHMVARRLPDLERRKRVWRMERPGEQVRWFPRSGGG